MLNMRNVYHIPQDPRVNAWAAFFAVILVGAIIAVGIWIWQTGNHNNNGKADNQTNAPERTSAVCVKQSTTEWRGAVEVRIP